MTQLVLVNMALSQYSNDNNYIIIIIINNYIICINN